MVIVTIGSAAVDADEGINSDEKRSSMDRTSETEELAPLPIGGLSSMMVTSPGVFLIKVMRPSSGSTYTSYSFGGSGWPDVFSSPSILASKFVKSDVCLILLPLDADLFPWLELSKLCPCVYQHSFGIFDLNNNISLPVSVHIPDVSSNRIEFTA